MIEFGMKKDHLPIPIKFDKIGNFELDILAIKKSNGTIVMLDHDQPDFVMGQVASNIQAMVKALIPVEAFYEAASLNDDLYDDENAMRNVISESTKSSGGKDHEWFYEMLFGI